MTPRHRPTRLVAAAATALLALLPALAPAKCQLQSFELPITMDGLRAVVHVGINGTPVPLTLDSGAFYSILSEGAADEFKLETRPYTKLDFYGLNGRMSMRATRVARLGLQGVELPNVEFLVGGFEPGRGTRGVLGRNVLGVADTEYDLAHGVVRLVWPSADCKDTPLAYWAGPSDAVVELPLADAGRETSRTPAITVEARINGQPVTALLDTGATSMLSLQAAKRVGLIDDEDRLKPDGVSHGADQRESPYWVVPMNLFELGSERISPSRIAVSSMHRRLEREMLLGIDYFLSHRIYVARSQGKVFLTYTGGPVFDMALKAATPAVASTGADVPDTASAWARRGSAYAARGELALALADLNRAVALEPAVAAHRSQRAQVLRRQNKPKDALADLDEALRLDPTADAARLSRAQLRHAQGATDDALDDLRQLDDRLSPQNDFRRDMSLLLLELREPRHAFQQIDLWITHHSRDRRVPEALYLRCWARALGKQELQAATEDCNDALSAHPDDTRALEARGMALLRRGRLKAALADFDAALAKEPQRPWALWGRGLAHLLNSQPEAAQRDLDAARTAAPGLPAAARQFGLEVPEGRGVR